VIHEWTPERVAEVRGYKENGKTHKEVAALVGVSRSAIAGVCNRHGIVEPDRPWRVRIRRAVYGKLPKNPAKPRVCAAPPAPVAPDMRKLALIGLTRDVCHFPVGDPGEPNFFFCGADATSTYCPFHHALTHRPPEPRRDRKPFIMHGDKRKWR
jgi:GcrA cell cycle regulator